MEAARFTTFNVAHGVIGSHYIGAHFAPDFVNTIGLFNYTLINSVIALIRVRRAQGFGPATANQCRNTVLRSIIIMRSEYVYYIKGPGSYVQDSLVPATCNS